MLPLWYIRESIGRLRRPRTKGAATNGGAFIFTMKHPHNSRHSTSRSLLLGRKGFVRPSCLSLFLSRIVRTCEILEQIVTFLFFLLLRFVCDRTIYVVSRRDTPCEKNMRRIYGRFILREKIIHNGVTV